MEYDGGWWLRSSTDKRTRFFFFFCSIHPLLTRQAGDASCFVFARTMTILTRTTLVIWPPSSLPASVLSRVTFWFIHGYCATSHEDLTSRYIINHILSWNNDAMLRATTVCTVCRFSDSESNRKVAKHDGKLPPPPLLHVVKFTAHTSNRNEGVLLRISECFCLQLSHFGRTLMTSTHTSNRLDSKCHAHMSLRN